MLELQNTTRFPAELSILQAEDGARHLLVVIKTSFVINKGKTEIAEPEAIFHDIQHYGDPALTSVKYESDFSLNKAATDVIVIGNAYSDGSRSIEVSVIAGPINKQLRVWGDRYWEQAFGVSPTEPRRFEVMPLTYERAYGGVELNDGVLAAWDPRNPVGCGFATRPSNVVGKLAPNIEYLRETMRSPKDRPRPAGLGCISRNWQPRLSYAGTFDDAWQRERFPLLPIDYNAKFVQTAPDDQQVFDHIRGGEPVELRNLTPDRDWAFRIPRVHFAFSTRIGGELHEHRAHISTLILEPNIRLCTLVWSTSVRCHGREHKIRSISVHEKEVLNSRHGGSLL